MSRNVTVTAQVDLGELEDDDLVEELTSRHLQARLPLTSDRARLERLYYRTRGALDERTIEDLRDLVADLYGRAA